MPAVPAREHEGSRAGLSGTLLDVVLPTCAGWGRIVPLMAAGRLFDYDRPLAASLAEKQEMLKAEINSEGADYFAWEPPRDDEMRCRIRWPDS